MQENILLTLKYFDLFDFPLKKEEIWRWLFRREAGDLSGDQNLKIQGDRNDFKAAFMEAINDGKVRERAEYYFLRGRGALVETRQARERISLKKMKKARKMAGLLARIPWVKMICVTSNLGYLNAAEGADIDFFIVTERGRVWTARFWCAGLMKILNQRPSQGKVQNKICLSYFVDEDNLNLEKTKVAEPDRHLIYLISQYTPIYIGRQGIKAEQNMWERFAQANEWIRKYLVNFEFGPGENRFLIKNRLLWLKKIVALAGGLFSERLYRAIQRRLMAEHLKRAEQRNDQSVIINDGMLKLHSNDRRKEINAMIKINDK